MYIILLYNETFTNGYATEALTIIDTVCILSSISVITSKNPIVSVLFLIALFLGIACHLLVSGISFIGLSYLLVYVGAVSILFLFILMLINIRISELLNDTSNTIPLVLIIALAFNYPLYHIFPSSLPSKSIYNVTHDSGLIDPYLNTVKNQIYDSYTDMIWFASFKVWDGSLAEASHISSIGNIMYTSYSIWLIITSVILLLAMVGAIVITIKHPE